MPPRGPALLDALLPVLLALALLAGPRPAAAQSPQDLKIDPQLRDLMLKAIQLCDQSVSVLLSHYHGWFK